MSRIWTWFHNILKISAIFTHFYSPVIYTIGSYQFLIFIFNPNPNPTFHFFKVSQVWQKNLKYFSHWFPITKGGTVLICTHQEVGECFLESLTRKYLVLGVGSIWCQFCTKDHPFSDNFTIRISQIFRYLQK